MVYISTEFKVIKERIVVDIVECENMWQLVIEGKHCYIFWS